MPSALLQVVSHHRGLAHMVWVRVVVVWFHDVRRCLSVLHSCALGSYCNCCMSTNKLHWESLWVQWYGDILVPSRLSKRYNDIQHVVGTYTTQHLQNPIAKACSVELQVYFAIAREVTYLRGESGVIKAPEMAPHEAV